MADILITKSRGKKYLGGSAPMVPSFIIGDDPVPLNPPGSNPIFDAGVGIKLNSQVIGGVKRIIELNDILDIPIHWQYIVSNLDVDGIIINDGEIILG